MMVLFICSWCVRHGHTYVVYLVPVCLVCVCDIPLYAIHVCNVRLVSSVLVFSTYMFSENCLL